MKTKSEREEKKENAKKLHKEVPKEKLKEIQPTITVVFQSEIDEQEQLSKEIADMYLDGRAFYYNGKQPPVNEKKEDKTANFIKFEDVQWNQIKEINV